MIQTLIDWAANNLVELAIGVPVIGVLLSALKLSANLINTVIEAVEDGDIDKEEKAEIIKDAKKVKGAWSLVWNAIKSLFVKKKK